MTLRFNVYDIKRFERKKNIYIFDITMPKKYRDILRTSLL